MRFIKTPSVPFCFFLLLLLLLDNPVLAGTDAGEPSRVGSLLAMSLEDLANLEVKLATGTARPLRTAPAVATVITAEDIERIGATTLEEALETVPGLHVVPSPTALLSPIYSIRGIHTDLNPQVLLLLDGIPLTSPNNGARTFNMLMPVAKISRIEVIRGPGSAVHGADAFAGTINVITDNASGRFENQAGVRAGSFDTYDAWLRYRGSQQGWEITTTIEYQESAGDSDRMIDSDTQTIFDNIFGTNASLAGKDPLDTDYKTLDTMLSLTKKNWTIYFWSMLKDDVGPGAGAANAIAPGNDLDSNQFLAHLRYKNDTLADSWKFRLDLAYLYNKGDNFFQLFPAGSLLPIGTDGNIGTKPLAGLVLFSDGSFGNPIVINQTTSLDLESVYNRIADHRLRIGLGIKHQVEENEQYKNNGPGVLDSTTIILAPPPAINIQGPGLTDFTNTDFIWLADQNRTVLYGSLQDEWSLTANWTLTAGIRYDHYSDFGNTVNPRAALVWETRYDLTTKLMYGRAFRPPSFAEQYAKHNPSTLGNKDLDPETIDVYELAIDYQPRENLRLALNLFQYDIHDLIVYVLDPPPLTTTSAQNARNQEGRGFEFETDWLLTDTLRLQGNFAYQRAENANNGEVVANVPELQAYASLHWTFLPSWSLDGQYFWIAGRHRAATDPRPDIKDYGITNLTLRRSNFAGHWEAVLAARNLFDENVREPGAASIPNDYPMEGQSLWAELRYTF